MSRIREVEAADAFLADEKRLHGEPPEFGPKANSRDGAAWEAVWPVENSSGIVEEGAHVRVRHAPASDKPFSIVLIFQDRPIFRLDFVAPTVCHRNPHWAAKMGKARLVCGPHCHTWAANREHAMMGNLGELPVREALAPQIRKFDQAFAWFAQQVNIRLDPGQRVFELPAELF